MTALTPTIQMPGGGVPLLSDQALAQMQQVGSLYHFLRMYSKADRTFDFFDFTENAAIGDYPFAVANSGGTGVASFAVPSTKIKNGAITGATGTTSGGSQSLIGQLILRGADNCGMEVRLQVDAVTAYNLEVGLIDAVPGSNGAGVSDVDTPAANFTNGAVFTIDTAQTITGLATVTKGNAASQAIAATTLAAPSPTGLVAATYMTFSVMLLQAGSSSSICNALFFINGHRVAQHTATAGALNAATLLAPWVYVKTNNTTTKNTTIDYVAQWSDRNA